MVPRKHSHVKLSAMQVQEKRDCEPETARYEYERFRHARCDRSLSKTLSSSMSKSRGAGPAKPPVSALLCRSTRGSPPIEI